MSEFFSPLPLETQHGQFSWRITRRHADVGAGDVAMGQAWEQDATAAGEVPEIIGAVDATFLERLLLVFLDLPTGYLVLEEAVEDRSYATWKGLVDKRLETLGAPCAPWSVTGRRPSSNSPNKGWSA